MNGNQASIARLHDVATDFQILRRIRDIAFVRADPVPNDGRTNHVRDEFVTLAIPRKKNRARTAATIDFDDLLRLGDGNFYFVLDNAGRPKQTYDVNLSALTESGKNFGRTLSWAAAAVNFPLLPRSPANTSTFVPSPLLLSANPFKEMRSDLF